MYFSEACGESSVSFLEDEGQAIYYKYCTVDRECGGSISSLLPGGQRLGYRLYILWTGNVMATLAVSPSPGEQRPAS